MGSNYKKIEFDSQGSYGSTEKRHLYIQYNRTGDFVAVFNQFGDCLFMYDEWGDFDMGHALVVALTNYDDERLLDCTPDEINTLKYK